VQSKGSYPLPSEICEGHRHGEEGHPPTSQWPPAEWQKTFG
jgi:hypothetical protein